MHKSRMVFLLPDDQEPQCILATYDPECPNDLTEFKTTDQTLEVGDMIIVGTNTRHGFTSAKVAEINVEPELESNKKMEWAICKFDVEEHETLLEQEATFLKAAQRGERKRKKKALRESLMGDLDTSNISLIEVDGS